MAFVRALVLGYRRYGADASQALKLAQITPAELARPDARITSAQMETVCGHAMQELDDEALGWYRRRMPWGSHGLLCRASLAAPTLGLALRRWCRHYRLLIDDIALTLSVDGATATLAVAEAVDLGALREFCLVTTLRYVHGYACWLVDSQLPLLAATFPYPAPPHAAAYPLMFPGPIRHGAACASLVFDAQYLALPPRRDEKALTAMLRRALPLTVLQYRRDRLLAQRVKALLRRHSAEFTHAEAIAAALQVSVRSLHRQLAAEGQTLQRLKDEARREQAIEQLRRSAKPIKQIALAVGYRNEKSFGRAFKGWTGMAPAEFRAAAIAG
ncbi:MAG: AraC family transcriptional regulator [Burkholderiales bacterium]|nr:helix-turn-helix transcriptional regulator [Burkholderiales bacterium]MDE1925655.1 AraC family transcriptional regulator [Burkholderiales bacterium]MDE2158354.1 AraC family transcriptional regulator [Burkholderiales bacterium]MDE2503424.1 AraC family transcriptional regulator [Burkholderiales bacterium]